MDPHDVLNLPREGFSMDQLKFNYKALARQLHPDKCKLSSEASTQLFQVLTEAYRKLKDDLDRKHVDRTFMELRDSARRSAPEQPAPRTKDTKDTKDMKADEPTTVGKRFNIEKFNRVFSDNRMEDPIFDTGYGKWMTETDPEVANKTGGRNLIRYEEPQPMVFTNKNTVPYTELGATKIDDYSCTETARHSIKYSDYRLAHTTTKLATDEEIREAEERAGKELRSVDVLKKHRANISYTMSDADARREEQRALEREDAERRRIASLSAYERTLEQFEQRTKFLLR